MKLVVLGLSLSSSWGNGHATTYRALLRAFAARGHDILFLEHEAPWYAAHRDLPSPDFCRLSFYDCPAALNRWQRELTEADAVIVGSYVANGTAIGDFVQQTALGVTAFYDIDTPITVAALGRGEETYIAARQIPGYDVYLSFTGGPILDLLQTRYRSPLACALYCSVDTKAYTARRIPYRWDLSYLGTYSPDRQPGLQRLLLEPARRAPHLRFVVAGPQYPSDVVWPENVERIEHVPPADHPDFYSASRFTLNITRADMALSGYSPSVRLFEAAACRSAIISDPWDGLETVLHSGEIVIASSTVDVLQALDMPQSARDLLAEAAHLRILASHTADHRAAQLEHALTEAVRGRASADSLIG